VNDTGKIPTSAYIHKLVERIGMGTDLDSGDSLTAAVNSLNSDLAVSCPVNVNDQNSAVRKCGRIGIYNLRTVDVPVPAIWESVNLGTIPDGYRPMYLAAHTFTAPSGTVLILRIYESGAITLQTVGTKNDTASGYLNFDIVYLI